MVHVCDAIMGSGKTQAAIQFMNSHIGSDTRFIYITPYLNEAKRIRVGCPKLHFVEPSNKIVEFGFRKLTHTMQLVSNGANIATTHSAFRAYSEEMLENIKRQKYTLIIDENIEMLSSYEIDNDDLQFALDAGYVKEENGRYSIVKRDYSGIWGKDFFDIFDADDATVSDTPDYAERRKTRSRAFFWLLPKDLLMSFSEVYILTYMFEGQSLHHFLRIYDIPYKYIGVRRITYGTGYSFCPVEESYIPEYVKDITDMIRVYEGKMNSVGDDKYALSLSWFQKDRGDIQQLRKNISNFFKHINKGVPAAGRMWSTFKRYSGTWKRNKRALGGDGYMRHFIPFNTNATNEYGNCTVLAYAINIYMNTGAYMFYRDHGIIVDQDRYALATMIQWIWRSAIRNGERVYIYIPSSRMRNLLTGWMESVKSSCHN